MIERGDNNAVIGSLLYRSEKSFGVKRDNPFCNEPLQYVFKTDLNTICNFKEIFVQNSLNILRSDNVQHKVQDHLTNGIQTSGNIFNQVGPIANQWQDIIHSELINYHEKYFGSNEGFIKSWPLDYDIYGWLVSMKNGGKLDPHIHDTGWITGSIYINVPPKSNLDSGNLVVSTVDSSDYNVKTENSLSIDVNTGSLCLFPSSLLHFTMPFESNEDRIVLAFDIIPKKVS